MAECCVIEIAGQRIELLPERAAWWSAGRALLVADLHLGKEQAFGSLGIGVPGGVLEETLARLSGCVERTGAERVIVVGDLIHAGLGLTPEIVDRVARWREGIAARMLVIPGNHDRDIGGVADRWALDIQNAEFRDGPFRFVHEPDKGAAGVYTWAGHLHPGVALAAGRDAVRLPCFCVGERVAVLPAFSRFTGRCRTPRSVGDRLFAASPERVVPVTAAMTGAR